MILGIKFSKAMIDVQWAFISIIVASLAHFILRIVLGKELGVEGLGVYTLAFTIYLFGVQFSGFGIGSALTKYVSEFIEDREIIPSYVSSGMASSIVTGVIMGIALFLLAPYIAISFFNTPELEVLIQLTAFCFPFIAVQKAVLGTLNGYRKMIFFAFLNILQNVGIVVLSVIIVINLGLGVLGAVIGFVIPTVLLGIFSPYLIRDDIKIRLLALWNSPAVRETTIFGFYVVLGNSISYVNAQISTILIGFYLNPIEVGIYAVAILFAQTITLIPSAVQRVTAPATANLYGRGDIEGVRKIIFTAMKKSFLISVCIAGLIAIFGQFLIIVFFSPQFLSAYIPLLILLLGYTVFAPFMAVGTTLASIGKVHVPFRVNGICAVLNIVLNIILIPFVGIIGAAIATTIANIVNFGINMVLIKRYIIQNI